ncbi:hypothetical protein N658DRAFT_282168 [Parathielavia hyrcaniae]|uniref:Uncharacterized protein n=1 Tax=Parathielavia hyrcaniae TaxID=113614 RepID=A0AAN6QAF9_9PEZI|nr:hypothetical protein N658DRAFT_282168 [Parathielavia hyrcaniae]
MWAVKSDLPRSFPNRDQQHRMQAGAGRDEVRCDQKPSIRPLHPPPSPSATYLCQGHQSYRKSRCRRACPRPARMQPHKTWRDVGATNLDGSRLKKATTVQYVVLTQRPSHMAVDTESITAAQPVTWPHQTRPEQAMELLLARILCSYWGSYLSWSIRVQDHGAERRENRSVCFLCHGTG